MPEDAYCNGAFKLKQICSNKVRAQQAGMHAMPPYSDFGAHTRTLQARHVIRGLTEVKLAFSASALNTNHAP